MYPDERVARFIMENFIPVRVHVRDQAADFRRLSERYGAHWTPAILELDSDGTERHRVEGFLDANEFLAQLTVGLGHIAFERKQWDAAERRFREVVERFPDSEAAPEGLYWAGAARSKMGDHEALAATARAFDAHYQDSAWAKKASVWHE